MRNLFLIAAFFIISLATPAMADSNDPSIVIKQGKNKTIIKLDPVAYDYIKKAQEKGHRVKINVNTDHNPYTRYDDNLTKNTGHNLGYIAGKLSD